MNSANRRMRGDGPAIEMKSILKTNKRVTMLPNLEDGSTTQRWTLPKTDLQVCSSAPSRPANVTKHTQRAPRQSDLKDPCSLQKCVLFIQHWKEQVDHVSKHGRCDPEEGTSKKEPGHSDQRSERSLEESRKLILEWADELHHVSKLLKGTPQTSESEEHENKDHGANERAELKITEWAEELQTVTESCGVQSDELGKVLRLLVLKKKRLVNLLPLLEFITWSLLKEDSVNKVPRLWLVAKQRTWKAGIPRYIPNSVWSWICSAAADVILDPTTNHPWLQLSDDQRMVQEGLSASVQPYSSQRFDSWPCVLGWEGYSSGRHYWEVDIANNGYWRVGLATANSNRHGRFSMTPKHGYWALWRSTHQFYACEKPEASLPVSLVPRRIGIYLDYEEGQISFYNTETKSHIYTFTGTFRGKLYPLFAPLDGRTLMRIIPPRNISEE
ncbi:nuclear factor 7, brain [Echeneis naucrates]|uniref:Nuclear factor 7, brain-like n=1 Tax=Echeneis naucrates TaxID=173247 RepID=A0A665W3B6_ECHNA|nr:nuclear factor 7, brain-like [Echeneis naucrates]